IARAARLSKLKEFYEPEGNKQVLFANAFYMATKVGGSVFDRVGSLEPGYRFNALVLDGLTDAGSTLTPEEQLERFCYIGDDRNIVGRYLDGKFITVE
ncbi:MAG: amidohydrolase family protein, partial [Erysipelotrichaceae bacterium]|nr:amidohydrolase family protein [Erysipelotrichaceae bacterium]